MNRKTAKDGLITIGSVFLLTAIILVTSTIVSPPVSTTQMYDTVWIYDPPKPPPPMMARGDIRKFLNKMGRIEGLGSYQTVSERGYLGLYQFSMKTLHILGFNVTREEFLNNPNLQDSAMIAFMKDNQNSLRGVIREFSGKMYNGILITKSGILASAHLVGPGGVLAYFYPDKYNFNTTDGNGTSIEKYMSEFAGYDLRGL